MHRPNGKKSQLYCKMVGGGRQRHTSALRGMQKPSRAKRAKMSEIEIFGLGASESTSRNGAVCFYI